MMKIGLLDIDGHNFPNYALMKISQYWKCEGAEVEWANPFEHYDIIYRSKIFTFSPDDMIYYDADKVVKGGTGYDIKSKLPYEIEISDLDYSIYPQYDFSVMFFSRGCIRKCPFCLVYEKEGHIQPVNPKNLNPNGKHIEVLDNNFFANPKWMEAVDFLNNTGQPVNLHGVDVRIMNEQQAKAINTMKLKSNIHIAWDNPNIDLRRQLEKILEWIPAYKLTCYVLIGFNSTMEQDLMRLYTLKSLGILPFVQPYRDYENKRKPTAYEKDLARWANRAWLFKSIDFHQFYPRKNFCCKQYFEL